RSALGKGSTFFALFPRESRTGVPLPQPRSIPGSRADSPTILVIDDDAHDQELLVRAITAVGFAVDTAATSAQALARCSARTYDAITLDILLPDGNGLKVLEAIRAGSRNADVPVIVVSVAAESAAGFAVQDALSKPLDAVRLLASLSRADVRP